MNSKFFNKIADWYKKQNDTVKAFIWIALICIIGIILRWDAIIDGITRGFKFYSHQ